MSFLNRARAKAWNRASRSAAVGVMRPLLDRPHVSQRGDRAADLGSSSDSSSVRMRSNNAASSAVGQGRTCTLLFKNLICAGEKRRWNFDTKHFRRLEINGEQVLGGLFNRQVGWFSPLQYSINVVSAPPGFTGKVRPIRNQSPRLHQVADEVHRWQPY